MKDGNKGVSMISLVITIIVIIILAAVSFNSSTDTISKANYSNYVRSVAEVQEAFSVAVANRKGDEAKKGKIKETAQVVRSVALGLSGDYMLNSKAEKLDYTIISDDAEKELGIELPELTVESATAAEVKVKYAVTPAGVVFGWPPIYDGNQYYASTEITANMTEEAGSVTIDGKSTSLVISSGDDGDCSLLKCSGDK